MILVTGAAGKTGQAIIRALTAKEQPVRALVRRAEQGQLLQELGAQEIVVGDMREAAVLAEATRGARAVYHICPNVSPHEIEIGRLIIDACRDAGVTHLVYHSVLHPQTEAMPHHWAKLRVEEALFASGLAYTILQPAAYMQNILGGWEAIHDRGEYVVPYDVESRLSLVDLTDVAEAAAIVLTEPAHIGATYELVGPEPLSQTDIAAILSQQLGRLVVARQIELNAWTADARRSVLDDYQLETLRQMFRYYDRHGLWGSSWALQQLLGCPPIRFEAFVQRILRKQQARSV